MPNVLTIVSTVTCGHNGNVIVAGEPKLKVKGNGALIKASIEQKGIPDCGIIPAVDSSGTETDRKCTLVNSVTRGEATKLKVNGNPVILDTLAGTTDGMEAKLIPQTKLAANANQVKLKAI